ncbi:MAG: Multidrug resistance protein mdtA [Anaerophaga sp.]|jgi:RND family efflux transporter MFP subunit|uniref:efflux RND transporter periplasmic adaptor subunit n=1 Tax=Anaerophaga thermohalophila TaxID=177400 RepID=UPI000312F750|nr:efflux RND transporter periplasmic adaptor subunit [Anaerophaga thermohalophila]MBZ4676479.1 Multidrug resistance protein mdtA [Anaerophaga sp.]MDI3521397.1 hypothetical protein [Anaerophaga sp.]MDK2840748.1 hypothetical protein [Anaerophaga sp.]
MRNMKISLLTMAVTALLFLNAGCSTNETEQKKELRYVKVTEAVAATTTVNEKQFNATIEENRQSSVAFRVGGTVESIYVDEGVFVERGELIAQLDQRDFKTNLLAAEAQYQQAKGEFERYSELYKQNKLPANTYAKMEAAFLSAKSNWESARNALTDAQLKAPFSGFVFQKLVNNHEAVAPGQPVFILIDTNILEVRFGVPESVVNLLGRGQKVEVVVNHHSGTRIPAIIQSVSHKAGDDHLFGVRLEMQNPDQGKVKPGMTAKVFIHNLSSANEDRHLVIPTESVFYSDEQANVWIYNSHENKVSRRNITTGELKGKGMIEVTNGLDPNEMIVTAGVHSLMEGQEVKPLF